MISIKSSGTFTGAGVVSAIAASLCCITPVVAVLAGTSSMAANFSWIEPARPFLIVISVAVLAFAWYIKLKHPKTNNMDCNCETLEKTSFIQSKTFLGIVTVLAILMMSFPLYAKVFYPKPKAQTTIFAVADNKEQVRFTIHGMTCAGCEELINSALSKMPGVLSYNTSYASKSSLVTFDKSKIDVKSIEAGINKSGYRVKSFDFIASSKTGVSFYEAPLVCHAAPSIGCGSKAKFILIDLEKYANEVEGAWLGKVGTVVAVKWKANTEVSTQVKILNTISYLHNIEFKPVTLTEANNYAKTFPAKKEWFKGKEVDQLSKEEALIIARHTIAGYKKDGLINASFEKQFQADIARIYENLFLSIHSYKDLTKDNYDKVEEQIQLAGEKYVGKGKMPRVELCISNVEKCEKDRSCSQSSGKSCCNKEE
jgi:copper chaperone CopZ